MESIEIREKENPKRVKEVYSTFRVYITSNAPNVTYSDEVKNGCSVKMMKPLVKKLEGAFDLEGNPVGEMQVGATYIFKATEFGESNFSPIKHIWFAEQLDDGEIIDLEYKKGENPYLDKEGIVCFKYVAKECSKVRIYAYVAKPIKKVSVEVNVVLKKVVVFYIGGASDKESFYGNQATKIVKNQVKSKFDAIINKAKLTNLYNSYYLGYEDARGALDIKNEITSKITDKENTAVYIVGHSLGGWNGAHLSQILTDLGYTVDMLVTLDPVGFGLRVQLVSDTYITYPKPKTNYWINISTDPNTNDPDDYIADVGGQWNPYDVPQINDEFKCHHGQAGILFFDPLKGTGISASDMMLQQIKLYLNR